jgi:hypothetical protein
VVLLHRELLGDPDAARGLGLALVLHLDPRGLAEGADDRQVLVLVHRAVEVHRLGGVLAQVRREEEGEHAREGEHEESGRSLAHGDASRR